MSIIKSTLDKIQAKVRTEGAPAVKVGSLHSVRDVATPHLMAAADGKQGLTRRPSVRLNRTELVRIGFLPPDYMQRQISAQFRHVKRPLLAAALGRGIEPVRNGRNIMLASSFPGEGKTFVSVNLAISMALERDISVVLVDADVAKPHISQALGVEDEPGLLEALQNEDLDIESLILPTDTPKLSILPAGKPNETATELLASHRMEAVVGRLGSSGDATRIIVFDSPPLLLTSESRVLAQLMGQVVLVVRAGFTQQHAVLDSIRCLGEGKSISLLLNQSESVSESGYYYRDGAYGGYAGDAPR
jgi:protein-tyrosine kinase